MKLGGDIKRIEIIPETDEELKAMKVLINEKPLIYWGDAGESFTPPECIGGLIINSS